MNVAKIESDLDALLSEVGGPGEAPSVIYEARGSPRGYEMRPPGGKALGTMDAETFEELYERGEAAM